MNWETILYNSLSHSEFWRELELVICVDFLEGIRDWRHQKDTRCHSGFFFGRFSSFAKWLLSPA